VAGEGEVWASLSDCCLDLVPDKQQKVDRGVDG